METLEKRVIVRISKDADLRLRKLAKSRKEKLSDTIRFCIEGQLNRAV